MPRIARIVSLGYPHHILHRGNNRQSIFFDDADRSFYLALLKKYTVECGCKVKAYCLMDNHVHSLLVPQQHDSLAKSMQKLSLTFTQYINKKYTRTGRLWECRFYSCVVDSDPYLWAVCRYIEKNPVRANMVEKPADYPWSSAKINTSRDIEGSFIEPIWKDYLNREAYIKFLNQADDERQIKRIRQSTSQGMPLGSEFFSKKIAEHFGISLAKRPKGRPRKNK